MIIRMTVQDNDYQFELKDFARKLPSRLKVNSDIKTYTKLTILFSPNETDKLYILKRINRIWIEYINNLWDDEQIKHYLISNFFVEIVDSFQEKRENGEYVYYFSNSNVVIAQ